MNLRENEDFVNDWLGQIDRGLEYKEKYSSASMWSTYRDYYRGEWGEGVPRPANRLFSSIRALIPRVYFRTPTITVTPLHPDFSVAASVLEAVDNWLVRELSLKRVVKRVIPDVALSGVGCIKIGFDSEFGYTSKQAVGSDGSTVTNVSRKTGEHIEYSQHVVPGMPWAIRVHPEDIVTPYGYSDPLSLPWVCHIIIRPLEDVKADQKYKNTEDLKGGYVPDLPHFQKWRFHLSRTEPDFHNHNMCALLEIRDARTKRMVVISEGKVLLDVPDELQTYGLPFEFVIFNEDPDHFWGIPDAKIILPHNVELNDNNVQMSRQLKLALLKFLVQKGVIDPEEKEKLTSTNVEDAGAAVEINSDALASSVVALQPHSLVEDLLRARNTTEADIREAIGFSRTQLGEYFPLTSKTATEVSLVQQASDIRVDERKDIVGDAIINIIKRWNSYIFRFWDVERYIQIAGPKGRVWVQFTGKELAGEYAYRVDVESGAPVTRAIRYAQAKELYMMLRGDPFIDQKALRSQLLRQFEWLDPTTEFLLTEPQVQGGPLFPPEASPGGSMKVGGGPQQ